MSYIKIKKIWTKKFEKKRVEEIFAFLKSLSPVPEKEWDQIDFLGATAKYGQFVHPETDKHDDSEGIQPKQMKLLEELLSNKLFYFLEKIVPALNQAASINFFRNYVSDGFISWNNVFDNHVLSVINNVQYEKKSLDFKIGLIIVSLNSIFSRFNSIEENVVEKIGQGVFTETTISEAISSGMLSPGERNLKIEHINLEGFFAERQKLWFDTHKIKPQSEEMLRVNPLNFDKKVLDIVDKVFGTRQIGKLQPVQQKWISLLIDNFGLNLSVFPEELVSKTSLVNQLNFNNSQVKDFSKALSKIIKTDISINLNNLKSILNAIHRYEPLEDFILKQDKLLENDLDVIFFIANIVNQITNTNVLNSLQAINPAYFRTFFRYRVQSYNDIIKLVQVFESSKGSKTSIPLISGKVGKYTYEIIDKDNPIGLILGYATDCCQVIGGAGESCLKAGYKEKDSTFFVVRKGDTVYAQSWIWSKKKTEFGSALCFDSIEVLGKDLEKSKDILKCYKDASEELLKHYDIVYAGADGNSMPNGLDKAGEFLSIKELRDNNMQCPYDTYSDLDHDEDLGGLIILNKKEK
jgi:hypothetical protein